MGDFVFVLYVFVFPGLRGFVFCTTPRRSQAHLKKKSLLEAGLWRVPKPPGADPLVAERAPWRFSQSRVTGGQQPIGNP